MFSDPLAAIFDDEAHSGEELREIIVGHSAENRLVVVSFTERAGVLRIISARRATKQDVKTMKKTRSNKRSPASADELLPEYRFDYSKARPNRFAARLKNGCRQVLLDPDVAEIFTTPESVNAVLRALIETMPK